jgi:hypothetical protein
MLSEKRIEVSSDSKIVHNNHPISMEVYRDPATEKDKLIVAASLFGEFPLVLQSWLLLFQIIFTLLVVFLDNLVKVFPLYFLS